MWVRSFSTRLTSVTFAEDKVLIFTALHGMQRGLTMRFLSVCLSVRLSVKRVDCDKTEESYV